MKKKFAFLLGIITLVILLIFILLLIPTQKLPAEDLATQIKEINKIILAKNYKKAEKALKQLEKFQPEHPEITLKLAKLYLLIGDRQQSTKYAEKVWEKGMKTPSIINLLLIANSQLPPKYLLVYISRFLEELPENRANNNFTADVYQDLGNYKNAQKIWQRYFQSKHVPLAERTEYALKIAKSRILNNNLQGAVNIMQTAMEEDCVNLASYNLYVSLCLVEGKFDLAEKLFNLCRQKYSSLELRLKKAMATFYKGEINEAESELQNLQSPISSSLSSLATNYNARMYLVLTRILTGHEQHTVFSDLILNSKESAAYLKNNSGHSKLLKLYLSPKTLEKEVIFYKALSNLVKKRPGSLQKFKSKSNQFPNHPVVDFLIMQAGLADNSNISAVSSSFSLAKNNKLSLIEGLHGFFFMSPPCIAEVAQVLYSLGAYKQADQFIQSLNNRKYLTSNEINILLKLAIKTKNQKLLNGLLKLKNINNYVDFEIIREVTDHPELSQKLYGNSVFKVISLANLGNAKEALDLCKKLNLSSKRKSLLQALIYSTGNDINKTEKLFKESLDAKNNFWGYREYANFLLKHNKQQKAQAIFEQIIAVKPKDISAITGLVDIMELQGKYKKAIEFLNKKIATNSPAIFLKLAKLNLKINDFPFALRYSNQVLKTLGKNDEALFYKTIALTGIYQQYPTDQNKFALNQISTFLGKLLKEEKNSLILTAYLESLFALQKFETFLKFISQNGIICSNAMLEREISALIATGRNADAKRKLTKNKNTLSNNYIILAQAEIEAAEGNYNTAINRLKKTKNRNLKYKAAEFATKTGNANEVFKIMSQISPTFIEWGCLAGIAADSKHTDLAFKFYEKALKLAPNNPLILNNYAWLGASTGKMQKNKAAAMINSAYSRTPTEGILETYLFVLDKYKMYDECQQLISKQKLLQTIPPAIVAQYLKIMKKGKKTDEVINIMENILKRENAFWKEFSISKDKIKEEYIKLKIK